MVNRALRFHQFISPLKRGILQISSREETEDNAFSDNFRGVFMLYLNQLHCKRNSFIRFIVK